MSNKIFTTENMAENSCYWKQSFRKLKLKKEKKKNYGSIFFYQTNSKLSFKSTLVGIPYPVVRLLRKLERKK